MSLETLLHQKKEEIVESWLMATFGLFSDESLRYLKKKKQDYYVNPLSHDLADGLEAIFHELLQGTDADRLAPVLDQVIRITSVQEGQASRALTFLFLLKKVVHDFAEAEQDYLQMTKDLFGFDHVVDQLIRMSFDIYSKCREDVYHLKVEEQRIQTHNLIQMVNKNKFEQRQPR